MALPILDGNQSATTLSSILTSGEHIPAHTVVSLGTQAITNIATAVSGSVVSISNFPATQPVSIASVTVGNTVTISGTVTVGNSVTISSLPALVAGTAQIGSVTASISNSVTIGSLPAISGTVTANVFGKDANSTATPQIPVISYDEGIVGAGSSYVVPVQVTNLGGQISEANPLAISGTVTVGNSVTISSLPALAAGTAQIGSVTASISNSVTIASFATSVTARLINPAGTAVTYAEVGTAGSPSIDVLSVQGVTSGTAIPISISSVTIGSLPAISGTVTANTFALQGTAVTTSDFTSTTASTLLAGFNAGREVLTIFNEGAGNLHICAGATCTTIAYQVRLSSGDFYEVPNHQTTITHSAVFATGGGTARVTEVS